ncbi:hypothetical protein Q6277_19400 [Klebsiella quasipneumoniae]|uniref:hypothetical protein n=2 Tax=Klebsiella pneumoniae complex TaxID=3390273 RepID=UPI0039C44EF7
MTVSTEVDHNDYTGNGVTTSFPYTFRIFKKSDLTVQVADLNENITVLTLDTDYSVTGAGTYSGGNVVLMSPLANGWQISISRDLPVTQDTDLRNQGKFFAEVHEDAFDKLTMLIQQCFSFLRLALRKPSFIANYYDALNNRIRNLRDPSQAQDAVTKSYADGLYDGAISYSDAQFERTLRVPESSVGLIPGVAARKNHILAFNSTGNPITVLPESGSAADVLIDLSSGEEGMGGDLVKANETYTVSDILRRMRTLGDVGAGRPVWGYDTTNDVKIYNAQAAAGADDIMMNGGLFLARKFRGTSRFAVVSGIRGGRASVDDAGAFRAQVVSVSSSLGVANYGLHDGVSDYADALLPALEPWETVASATYSANTVTISPETYSETLKNILKGDVIRTRHTEKYWGTVQSVNPQTGVITVDMWALRDSPNLTPANNGSGFYVNFIDKVWADNKNVIVQPNSAGLYATVGEFGALVQKAGMGYVNGMDMVLLAGSTQDATAAFLARSGASGHGWLYGFNAQGNRFNFYSDSGEVTPYAGFLENSNAIVGMKFRNKNTYSQAWSNSTDLTAVNPSALTAIIGPAGHVFRRPERILTLSASGMLDQFYPTVYVTAAGITITMPDITQMPVAGYVFKVRLFLAGTYIFNTYQGQTTIDGNPQLTVTTTSARQTIEIQFDGTFWQTFLR